MTTATFRLHWLGCCGAIASTLVACAEMAKLPPTAGVGPTPTLTEPTSTVVPTVNIAPAKGWGPDQMPVPSRDLRVVKFADGLDHPRWLYVFPNGDVLVAETNAPPRKPPSGIRAWVMNKFMTQGRREHRLARE